MICGCLVFPHYPLGGHVSESSSAEIGEKVDLVILFVILVFAHVCRHVKMRFVECMV